MKEKHYQKINRLFDSCPGLELSVLLANKISTSFVYLFYPVLLIVLAVMRDGRFLKEILVPAIGYIVLSFARTKVNAPRPYEKYNFRPAIIRNGGGNSFPSRHVFSAFLIAMGGFYVNPFCGAFPALAGLILGVCRVLGGVHFPRDVVCGALLGILAGITGFYIL